MLTILLCVAALGQTALGQDPLVTTSQGTLKGQILQSRDSRNFFSFTKIPYAKPPIGPLRFMISEKVDNWNGTLDATLLIPSCYQLGQDGPTGQEDCLYLNVFSPNISGKYPVIFSIHGGGFMVGTAEMFSRARYFMDENVVFVAPNYRVGTLGFLSLEDSVIPGNMGLKDQALALEWVKREISAFGGDPNLITVIGESAGGVSSNLICEAPRTNGLIKGCVSQSGDGWSYWANQKPGTARQRALHLAKKVNCTENGDLLKCLQSKPLQLVGDMSLLSDNEARLSIVSPVVEPADAPGALLISWPTKANHNFPWIVGVTQDDGMLFTYEYEFKMKNQAETEQFINGFNKTITTELNLENRTDAVQKIRERFFKKGVEPLRAIRNFFTEYMFLYPAMKGLSKHSGETYFYKFNYTGGPQFPSFRTNVPAIGVGHAAEMPYLFEVPYQIQGWPSFADTALSKLLVKTLVDFARDQKPSSVWPQFQKQYFLDIQNTRIRAGNYTEYQEILDFWGSIFPDQSSKSSTIQSSLLFIAALSIFSILKTQCT